MANKMLFVPKNQVTNKVEDIGNGLPPMRKCKECGEMFQPKGREQFCSKLHYRPCPTCGKPVEAKYLSDPAKYCSPECRKLGRSKSKSTVPASFKPDKAALQSPSPDSSSEADTYKRHQGEIYVNGNFYYTGVLYQGIDDPKVFCSIEKIEEIYATVMLIMYSGERAEHYSSLSLPTFRKRFKVSEEFSLEDVDVDKQIEDLSGGLIHKVHLKVSYSERLKEFLESK